MMDFNLTESKRDHYRDGFVSFSVDKLLVVDFVMSPGYKEELDLILNHTHKQYVALIKL